MTVKAMTDGKRIQTYDIPFRMKDAAKAIPGCKAMWDKSGPKDVFLGWSYPLTMDTCHELRRTFGRDLAIHTTLIQWYRAEAARQAGMEEIRSGNAAELPRVRELLPDMYAAMMSRSYQPVGASFIVHGENVLLGDDPGLGKTIQTLAALVEKGCKRILVACPKTTANSVWRNETNYWAPIIMPFVASGDLNRAQREQVIASFEEMPYSGPKMLIINTEMIRAQRVWHCTEPAPGARNITMIRVPGKKRLQYDPPLPKWRKPPGRKGGCMLDHKHDVTFEYTWPQLFAHQWDAIVIDEGQKDSVISTTKNIQSKDITQARLGAVHLRRLLAPGGLSVALSGTPFLSDLHRAWGTLNWLAPDVFTSYHNWAQRHFRQLPGNGWGMGEYDKKPMDMEKFQNDLRPYMLARDKTTAAPDLPPVQFMGTPPVGRKDGVLAVRLPLLPQQEKAYREMAADAMARVDNGSITAAGVLAELTRLRQFASAYGEITSSREFKPSLPSNKIEWLLEFLSEREDSGTKMIIGSEFTQLIELTASVIRKETGYEVMTLTGDTRQRDRDLLVARFQDMNDPLRVVAVNMKAGGVGITLDAADDVILFDVPWKSDTEKQFIDRAHRVSRVHRVFAWRLLSADTVDEHMADINEEQREILASAGPRALKEIMEAV